MALFTRSSEGPGSYTGQAASQLQGAQAAGFFSPTGSPLIMGLTRRNALRNADNARRRSALLSRLMGLDPNQARVAQLGQEAASSGATQEALNQANLGQLLGNQQYFRGLFGQQLGNEQQRELMRYQQELSRPSFGDIAGGIIGQGLGAFAGGYGSSLGQPRQPRPYRGGPYAP